MEYEDKKRFVLSEIKKRIGSTDEYEKFFSNYSILEDKDGKERLNFRFVWKNEYKRSSDTLEIECNDDCIVKEYKTETHSPKIKSEKLKKKVENAETYLKTAQKFIDEINPKF